MSTGVTIIMLTFSALLEEGITHFKYFFYMRKLAEDHVNDGCSYDIIYFWFLEGDESMSLWPRPAGDM